MVTLAMENIHYTILKETKPMPISYRVKLNSVPVFVSEKLEKLFAINLDLKWSYFLFLSQFLLLLWAFAYQFPCFCYSFRL